MRAVIGIAVAGALGALARHAVQQAVPRPGDVPWGTFAVNVLGALVAGVLVALLARRLDLPMWAQEALFVGFLGGFTTFSAFSLETALLVERGRIGVAFAYAGGSLAAGVAAVLAGLRVGRLL
ncbi:MAG: fluoride efflux transporter FluC [Actinomycetota bacterium]